jgi:hypothetical protein
MAVLSKQHKLKQNQPSLWGECNRKDESIFTIIIVSVKIVGGLFFAECCIKVIQDHKIIDV